ncbi:transcriptional regulator [Arsukibacterium ikkense]|uniref:Transcriptional regulator n=1 Tax=Arsukibacterium ikkense TaxID=336831 RepID=A0A0M2VAH4_9GAMM|nr:winged helix-turn-helix domain-containing protein [Arsukibacterium ikkense]KKO46128.1 transcriptional regulator [Arsukibacterium ikkense]
MLYAFKDFKFDSDSLLLTKNGEPLEVRHNELKLLALLLEHSARVLSKEHILSYVWQDKVVSEQVVFQNISQLRSIFGDDAIKTFPKRGYQWQLNTEAISPPQTEVTLTQASSESTQAATPVKRPLWLYAVLASFVFVLITVIYWPIDTDQQGMEPAIKLAYIPFAMPQENTDFGDFTAITLNDNARFNVTALTHLTSEQFQMSAELEYPLLAEAHPFILTGEVRAYKQQLYLDFLLKGPFADWQGQLSAESDKALIDQLLTHLQQPFIYDLLSQPLSPELKQAKLSIAHQLAPEDLIVLGSLISVYRETREHEKAMVLADKLASIALSQHNPQQLGNALLYQSEILTGMKLFDLSSQKLALAIEQFEKIDDLKRQADVWHAQSWLDDQNNDYPAVKSSLLKSALLAYNANDKPRELDALTYLSKMALVHQLEDEKYHYLQQAENKMKAYQLPSYHFAMVPFHYAIFAANPSDKEPHLKQVLEFTTLTPDHWAAQSSRQQLLKHYINQNRLTEAQTLVDSLASDNAQNAYLKTLLAQALQQTEAMIRYGTRAFEQAKLSGNQWLSLDVALLLCNTPNIQLNHDFYAQYIIDNATASWRQNNQMQLVALNL